MAYTAENSCSVRDGVVQLLPAHLPHGYIEDHSSYALRIHLTNTSQGHWAWTHLVNWKSFVQASEKKKKSIVEGNKRKRLFMSLKTMNSLKQLCVSDSVSMEPTDWWPSHVWHAPCLAQISCAIGKNSQHGCGHSPQALCPPPHVMNCLQLVKELHFQVTLSTREQGQEIYLRSCGRGMLYF